MVSQFEGFLARKLAFEELKEYRFMLTLQDVDRAAVPFPDTITIEYPPAEHFARDHREADRKYESVDLVERDAHDAPILNELDKPIVDAVRATRRRWRTCSSTSRRPPRPRALPDGIPIYVDPVGLDEAEKTIQSPVTLEPGGRAAEDDAEAVLKQLGLTYTVKDGLMTITSERPRTSRPRSASTRSPTWRSSRCRS